MIIFCFVLIIICIAEGVIIWNLAKDENEMIQNKIEFFRAFWGKFVIYVLATSVIGLFLGSIYFKQVIGLEEINSWVSIVLGLVALIIGIISLFLSFYNVDQAIESQKQSMDIMEKVKEDIQGKINTLGISMQKGFDEIHKEVSDYKGETHEKVVATEVRKRDWGELKDDDK